MTPKEKAKELVDRFNLPSGLMSIERKQCALIAVDEMLETLWDLDKNEFENNYWQRVKEEIINL